MNEADVVHTRLYWGQGLPQKIVLATDSNGNPTYIAIGARGAATSQAAWIVRKITYDSNGLFSNQKHSPEQSIADNYASLSYK